MIQAIGWLAATILLLLFEASTFNLVSIWFAAGSAAALITCLFTGSLRVQSAVFVAVSILCLLAFRPLVRRLRRPHAPTNGDLNIGRIAPTPNPAAPAWTAWTGTPRPSPAPPSPPAKSAASPPSAAPCSSSSLSRSKRPFRQTNQEVLCIPILSLSNGGNAG